MSLGLQLVTQAYSDREYWNERYAKSNGSCFDWYQRYETLKHVINPLIAKDAVILQVSVLPDVQCSAFVPDMSCWRSQRVVEHCSIPQVGVGNSRLQLDMSLDGYTSILSVDYAQVVIEQMQESHQQYPQLRYDVADARQVYDIFTADLQRLSHTRYDQLSEICIPVGRALALFIASVKK